MRVSDGGEINDRVRFGDVVTPGGHHAPVFEPVE
jgi:hypothetical protein